MRRNIIAAVPLAYRVDDAAKMIGLSKSKVWELISEGRLEARKLDGATVILHPSLETYLAAAPVIDPAKRAQSASK